MCHLSVWKSKDEWNLLLWILRCYVRQFRFPVTRILRASDRCRMFPPVSLRIITAQLLVNQACGLDGSFSGQPKKLGVLECHLESFRVSPWNFNSFLSHWTLFQWFCQNIGVFVPVWEVLIDFALDFHFVDLEISSEPFWKNLCAFFWWLWAFTAF